MVVKVQRYFALDKKDFYEPEFTCHSIDEVTLSIMKAKELISKWN